MKRIRPTKTGHGQDHCGIEDCKGGCENNPKSKYFTSNKSSHQLAMENRPTVNTPSETVRELAPLLGRDEDLKVNGLVLFEKLSTACKVTNSPQKYFTKEESSKVLTLLGYEQIEDGIFCKEERSEYAVNLSRPSRTYFNLHTMSYSHNSAYTDSQTDSYYDINERGKSALSHLSWELERVLEKNGMRAEVDRTNKKISNYRAELEKDKKLKKYLGMSPSEYIGPSMFWDRMRSLQEDNPIIQPVNLGADLKGFKIAEDTYLLLNGSVELT